MDLNILAEKIGIEINKHPLNTPMVSICEWDFNIKSFPKVHIDAESLTIINGRVKNEQQLWTFSGMAKLIITDELNVPSSTICEIVGSVYVTPYKVKQTGEILPEIISIVITKITIKPNENI